MKDWYRPWNLTQRAQLRESRHMTYLWVRFHGQYWYQSFVDGSNIWGDHRTDPWGPEMNHPPLGRSYLVVVPSYDMSCVLIFLTGLYGWDSMANVNINPSLMGLIFGVWIGPNLGVQLLGCTGIPLCGIANCYLHKIHGSASAESNIAANIAALQHKLVADIIF